MGSKRFQTIVLHTMPRLPQRTCKRRRAIPLCIKSNAELWMQKVPWTSGNVENTRHDRFSKIAVPALQDVLTHQPVVDLDPTMVDLDPTMVDLEIPELLPYATMIQKQLWDFSWRVPPLMVVKQWWPWRWIRRNQLTLKDATV